VTAIRITLEQARHAWAVQQRLGGDDVGPRPFPDAMADIGWIAMPSPVTPYLALFARGLIANRADLDARLGDFSIVPGPRGSTWFVPTADAPLARAFAVADHATREARIAATTTLPSRELAATRELIRTLLGAPVTLDELRAKLPESALRSLGAPGRKAGMPTFASMVLRAMWVEGEVQRTVREGRLDSPTVTWSVDPRPRVVPPAADAVAQVAARWIHAHGPVTARAFANTFGTPTGRAMPALRAARPLDVAIEGIDEVFLASPQFTPRATSPLPPRFLPARDPLSEVHLPMIASVEGARRATTRAGYAGAIAIADGRAVATWTFDPARGAIDLAPLEEGMPEHLHAGLEREAARVAAFARSESLTMASHAPPMPVPRGRAGVLANDLAIEL
jgi:hypothetical protein